MWSESEPIYRIATHSTAKAWRERLGRYRLVGSHCPSCESDFFPERHVCVNCHETVLEPKEFSRKGVVICKGTDFSPLMGHAEEVPKTFGVIRLEGGPYVIADIVDCDADSVTDGLKVEMVLRKWRRETNGNYMYGYKFRPISEGS